MSNRVIHFEINADDPERAAKFYQEVFGWKIKKWDGPVAYWLVTTGMESEPGIDGAIKDRSQTLQTVNTIQVDSIEDAIKKVTSAGGKLIKDKVQIPGIGWHAYVKDSEGNVVGLMQNVQTGAESETHLS